MQCIQEKSELRMNNLNQIVGQSALSTLIKFNYFGWAIFFVVFHFYCVFWREYGANIGFSFNDSLIWFFKEWGAWVLLSAGLLYLLEKPMDKIPRWVNIVLTSLCFLLAVFGARVYLSSGEYAVETLTIIVVLFPKYLSAFVIFMTLWYFVKQHLEASHAVEGENQDLAELPCILIEHNGLNVSVLLDNIVSLKTAGNYVEIHDGERTYLKRTTLKNMLSELADNNFVQVHRSYVINLNKLHRLINLENGSGMAILVNQQNIPVSKRYKSSLKSMAISSGNLAAASPV